MTRSNTYSILVSPACVWDVYTVCGVGEEKLSSSSDTYTSVDNEFSAAETNVKSLKYPYLQRRELNSLPTREEFFFLNQI